MTPTPNPSPSALPATPLPTPTPLSATSTPASAGPTLEATAQVDALLRGMTLEQKIGQVMIIGFDGLTASEDLRAMIRQQAVGGVILFARNVESPAQVAALTRDLQETALRSGHPGLIIAIDQEGGRVARLTEGAGFTQFPGAMALSATGDPDLVRRVGQATAQEMKAVGLNADFAPVLDVNNNPKNPVIGIRSFGSDPARVAQYGLAFMQGLQNEGVLAFGKHFPGHGDTATDSHLALPVVPHDRNRLEAVELAPFKAAIRAGVSGIMTAHVSFPAIETVIPDLPATLSPRVLTGLLREEMGFGGLIVTDSLEMGALGQSGFPVSRAAAMALQAGADLLLFNRDHSLHRLAIQTIADWIQEGKIPISRLDEAARRVLLTKARYGLLQPALPDAGQAAAQVGTQAHRDLSAEAARRSITLVRDETGLLPLPSGASLLVIETTGGRGLARALGATSIEIGDQPKDVEIANLVGLAAGRRAVVVATSDALLNPAQAKLVKALLAARAPVIVVAVRGPYDLLAFPEAPVYLATYGAPPATLTALASVLRGEIKAAGVLPVELTPR